MSALTTLAGTEARLLTREWAAMVFAFAFPPLFMLVLAGVFGNEDDMGGTGVSGTDYYIAGYIGVPMGALALVGLPVMLASYRERDVLRRFEAFGVPTSRVVAAQALVTAVLIVLAAGLVVATAAPIYGIPPIEDVWGVVAGFVAGTITMISLGVVLGLAVPTARAAQALGLLVFMPMWLLGGGGPPPEVMSDAMQRISDVLPLTHATTAIREAWLSGDPVGGHLVALGVWLAVGIVAIAVLLRRRDIRA
jgi:ABC-2 type transport system permease protein